MTGPGESPDPLAPGRPLATSAPPALHEVMFGHVHSAALRAVAVHRIPDHLADGPRTPEELASLTGTDAAALRRVLRLLAVLGLFHEDERGRFRLEAAGRPLRTDVPHSQHAGVLMVTDPMIVRSAAELPVSLGGGRSPFERAYGGPFFEHLRKSPEDRAVFDAGMAAFSGREDELVAQAYPFPERARVVDVGGGRGGLLRAVLRRGPALDGVLFDRPGTVAGHLLDEPALTGRWRTEGGDFFETVPPGGDLYVLKHVLHDWDDEDAVRILGSVRRAAAAGTRLLVVDAVLPGGGVPHPAVELDIVMLLVVEGRERTAAEFEELLSRAGFRLHRILPTPSLPSVIEAVAV
ncbi:methyltransferase [Streptomyces racemochromogenes]|uniref:Methyltransferase n=1 Tax=Streptomyces racemochromogenes TaxID=67353 RepID=A0ABW7PB86_9ACTN